MLFYWHHDLQPIYRCYWGNWEQLPTCHHVPTGIISNKEKHKRLTSGLELCFSLAHFVLFHIIILSLPLKSTPSWHTMGNSLLIHLFIENLLEGVASRT